jgi:hypothetical protein
MNGLDSLSDQALVTVAKCSLTLNELFRRQRFGLRDPAIARFGSHVFAGRKLADAAQLE